MKVSGAKEGGSRVQFMESERELTAATRSARPEEERGRCAAAVVQRAERTDVTDCAVDPAAADTERSDDSAGPAESVRSDSATVEWSPADDEEETQDSAGVGGVVAAGFEC